MIGPFSKPVTGVSLANDKILELCLTKNCVIKTINTSYFSFKEKSGGFSFTKVFFYLKSHLKLYKILNVSYVYITIGQTFFGILKYGFALILSRLLGKKIIVHLHGNELGKNYINASSIQKYIFRKLIGCADIGIVLSEGLKYNLSFFFKEKQIYVLNNFIDYKILGTEEEIKNKNFNTLKLLFLSNLMTEKGIFELLEAIKDLQNENIFIPVEFYGNIDVVNKDLILKKIKKLGKNVTYKGIANKLEKRRAFIRNNVFILPSYNEGMPLSVLEAMGTGNMLIVSDLDGLKGVLKNNLNAILISSRSSREIKDALKEVSENTSYFKKNGKENYIKVKNEFTENQFISGLEKIFNQI